MQSSLCCLSNSSHFIEGDVKTQRPTVQHYSDRLGSEVHESPFMTYQHHHKILGSRLYGLHTITYNRIQSHYHCVCNLGRVKGKCKGLEISVVKEKENQVIL